MYKNGIDFAALGLKSPDFAKHLKAKGHLDFGDPAAVQELTRVLLKSDFGLDIQLPDDRLCPPIPNRFNYILWIQDLLDTTSEGWTDRFEPARDVIGLDIGTGASCIYPLLGCSQRPKWRFIGTDIDEKCLEYAQSNVNLNKLGPRIKLLKTTPDDPLVPFDILKLDRLDFTISNPPFYSSVEELLASAAQKARPPFSACTGTAIEMTTPGGELEFVTSQLNLSLSLRTRVQWYTSLIGKLSTLHALLPRLSQHGITNFAITEFIQGTKTRRWGLAWSFCDRRPSLEVSRGSCKAVGKAQLPVATEVVWNIGQLSIDAVMDILESEMDALDVAWRFKRNVGVGVGFAWEKCWGRGARRKKAREGEKNNEGEDEDEDEDKNVEQAGLGFKISLRAGMASDGITVTVRWLKGFDAILFESFCGTLKRKLVRSPS